MVALKMNEKALLANNRILYSAFLPVYMGTPAMAFQSSDEYNGIKFAWNYVDGVKKELPLKNGGCTLFSYYHSCQTINQKYGGYVADNFLDWFDHYGGENYFKSIYYYDLFSTLETLTGIHCENSSAKIKITSENYNDIKQAIYDELCSGMPVTMAITVYGASGSTGGHSIMAKGIDTDGKLIICDSLEVSEVKISYEDLFEINGHDGYNIVRFTSKND